MATPNLAPKPVRAGPFVQPKPFDPSTLRQTLAKGTTATKVGPLRRVPIAEAKAPSRVERSRARVARSKPAPHEFPSYEAPEDVGVYCSTPVNPKELHKLLAVAPYIRMKFDSEKKLMNFRRLLYSVNVENKFRYATRREGWTGLIILRLK